MASPMVEGGRVDPHKKAHFSLHISDRIAAGDGTLGSYSSVKFNHKPAQTTASRNTTLTASGTSCNLKLEDSKDGGKKDVFTFTGQRTQPKSYILLFDASSQKATLEPLTDTYTFNLARKNNQDVSSQYPKIYPKKQKPDSQGAEGMDDLFDNDGENDEPDPDNPYDFRHFLTKEKEKRGDESEYNASSPDYKAGSGSAMDTPLLAPRKAAAPAPKPKPEPKPRKRKEQTADPLVTRKPPVKKAQPPPSVRLDRRATERAPEPAPAPAPKARGRAANPPASKIKSAEIVHSSDESDIDADGEPDPVSSPPAPVLRSPSPAPRPVSDHEDDEDEDEEDDMDLGGGLEIEVPDERPAKSRTTALGSLGLGASLGLGYRNSPANGPISLASAANSVEGSPNPAYRNRNAREDNGEIDFGSFGGADESDEDVREDRDVEPMDLGPPVQAQGAEDDDDPLYQEMMMGLADSSEESEEE